MVPIKDQSLEPPTNLSTYHLSEASRARNDFRIYLDFIILSTVLIPPTYIPSFTAKMNSPGISSTHMISVTLKSSR